MTSPNALFVKDEPEYIRNLNVIDSAIHIAALYLHKKTNKDFNQCLEFVERKAKKEGRNLKVLERQDNGDRAKKVININSFLNTVSTTNSILTPNLVVYDDTNKNLSLTSEYIDGKMKQRGVVKKRGLLAKQSGNMEIFDICNNQEYRIKVGINSSSGARNSPHNPLYNKTAHSTLTSNCRIMVSYSNASAERVISGNRHYFSLNVILENIMTTINLFDFVNLAYVVEKYNIHIPSVTEVFQMIKFSSNFYWRNPNWDSIIISLLEKLKPLELTAIMYVGDLHHLKEYNPGLVRELLRSALERPENNKTVDTDSILKNTTEGMLSLVNILCSDLLEGDSISKLKERDLEKYNIIGLTIIHVWDTLTKYKDLLWVFLINRCPPSNIFNFPTSIRRNVVGSDTDSTMFSVQDWVDWYYGETIFTKEAMDLANFICFLNTEVIGHWLAMASKQLGVADQNLYRLQMKNEFSFPVYIRTNRAKHYFAPIASREGIVYKKLNYELKGVALKDSKAPKFIMKALENEFINISTTIMTGKKIKIHELMQRVANLEHDIYNSLSRGEIKYLTTMNVGLRNSYKKPMSSGYMHYDLWINVFQPLWGEISTPPYRTIKVTTTLTNKGYMLRWVNTFPPEIRDSLLKWMEENNKTKLGMLRMPYELFSNGLPPEVVSVMNIRKIISEMMEGYYIMMESLGFYIRNKKFSVLLMDECIERKEYGLPRLLTNEEL